MARQRLTWKTASPPPQMPAVDRTEAPDHPAHYEDPAANKYEKGDTSSWAEDPKNPMIPESAPPAMPGNLTTQPLEHPATSDFEKGAEKPEKPPAAKQAANLTAMIERKAHLCVRIAGAIMPGAKVAEVEQRALQLMDMDDAQLQATAATLQIAMDEDGDCKEEEKEEVEVAKEAAHDLTARLDRMEANFGRLVKAMGHFFSSSDPKRAGEEMDEDQLMAYLMGEDRDGDGIDQSKNSFPQGYDVDKMSGEDPDEAMLKAMIEEMDDDTKVEVTASHAEDVVEPLAKGKGIQSGEGGNVNPDAAPKTPQVEGPMKAAGEEEVEEKTEVEEEDKKPWETDKEAAENDIDITAGLDPMGLLDATHEASGSADELNQLYNEYFGGKKAGEEESEEIIMEEEPAEQTDKTARGKAASGRQPQGKTTPKGAAPKTVGSLTREAADDLAQLSDLWDSAPDVSQYFNGR